MPGQVDLSALERWLPEPDERSPKLFGLDRSFRSLDDLRPNLESDMDDAELLDRVCTVLRGHGYAPTRIQLPTGLVVDVVSAPEPMSPAERAVVQEQRRELKALGIRDD